MSGPVNEQMAADFARIDEMVERSCAVRWRHLGDAKLVTNNLAVLLCETCGDHRTIPCGECGGRCFIYWAGPDGPEREVCGDCDGTGDQPCPDCEGDDG